MKRVGAAAVEVREGELMFVLCGGFLLWSVRILWKF